MRIHHGDRPNQVAVLVRLVGWAGIPVGLLCGILVGVKPALLIALTVAIAAVLYFFNAVEQVILGLLILRSSLDIFSDFKVPSAFALGIDVLAILYIIVQILSRRPVKTDGFWWFLAGWVGLQSLWVILLPLGGLGLGSSELPDAIREWIRLGSFLMVYLLVMQLKDRIPPQRVVTLLFLSLIAPLTGALLQVLLPDSLLPSILSTVAADGEMDTASRIRGTLGHPNSFAAFSVLFCGLTIWKLGHAKQRLPWLLLLMVIAFFLVSSQSLTGLMMLVTFVFTFFLPRFNLLNMVGGILLIIIVTALFLSTEFGQERIAQLYSTPLLNPNMDWSRSVAIQLSDSSQANSFNWRVAQWAFLLRSWEKYPLWGYGLATSSTVSIFNNSAHNDYIRALVEGGIVGLTLFFIFLFAQFVRLLQLLRTPPLHPARQQLCYVLLAFLIAMMIGMLAGNVMVQTTLWFYWWTLMAVAGWDWRPSESPPASNAPDRPLVTSGRM